MNDYSSYTLPERKTPAREAATSPKHTEHIFVTCCTRNRLRALDNPRAQSVLLSCWRDRSHWSINRYVIMPDHVHLMLFPSQGSTINLRRWAAWWKARATRELGYTRGHLWLPDLWDTRMRNEEHRAAKLIYMRENPVRAGLVIHADLWPFQGDLFAPVSEPAEAQPQVAKVIKGH